MSHPKNLLSLKYLSNAFSKISHSPSYVAKYARLALLHVTRPYFPFFSWPCILHMHDATSLSFSPTCLVTFSGTYSRSIKPWQTLSIDCSRSDYRIVGHIATEGTCVLHLAGLHVHESSHFACGYLCFDGIVILYLCTRLRVGGLRLLYTSYLPFAWC